MATEILEEITRFYLGSGDFNGLPVRAIVKSLGKRETRKQIGELVSAGLVAVSSARICSVSFAIA